MRQGVVGMVLAVTATMGGGTAHAQGGSAAVRPDGSALRELITGGMKRSATFRDLNTRLDDTDVVVYVRSSRCLAGVPACLVWASADANARRLLIKIDTFGRSPAELTALLAHELQHAHEVAAEREIRDAASFQRSFASHGWKNGAGFETEAARKVAAIVAAELSRGVRSSRGRESSLSDAPANRASAVRR